MTLIRAQPCVTPESCISLTYILCIYISHLFTLYKYISLIVLVHIIQTYIYILCESVNLYIIPTYVMLLPTVINFPSTSPGSICAKSNFYPLYDPSMPNRQKYHNCIEARAEFQSCHLSAKSIAQPLPPLLSNDSSVKGFAISYKESSCIITAQYLRVTNSYTSFLFA